MTDDPLLFDPGDPVSWMMQSVPGVSLPNTGGAATALFGLTFTSLYPCSESSGSLVDVINGNNLAAVNTPTHGVTVGDRPGIHYDALADAHRADVNPLGAASGLYMVCFIPPAAQGAYNNAVGRWATSLHGAYAYMNTGANTCTAVAGDGSGSLAIINDTTDLRTLQVPLLLGLQIDRAAAIFRMRISRRGANLCDRTASIAGFASLTGGVQAFGFGEVSGSVRGGSRVSWGAVATGVQCEGAALLATLFQRAGFG